MRFNKDIINARFSKTIGFDEDFMSLMNALENDLFENSNNNFTITKNGSFLFSNTNMQVLTNGRTIRKIIQIEINDTIEQFIKATNPYTTLSAINGGLEAFDKHAIIDSHVIDTFTNFVTYVNKHDIDDFDIVSLVKNRHNNNTSRIAEMTHRFGDITVWIKTYIYQ